MWHRSPALDGEGELGVPAAALVGPAASAEEKGWVVANRDVRGVTGIDAATLRAMYRHMLRARLLDERIWLLNRQGVVPFWVSGMGQEAIQVGLGMHLRPGVDWVAPYYRDLALSLLLGMTPRDHLLAAFAKAADPSTGGRHAGPLQQPAAQHRQLRVGGGHPADPRHRGRARLQDPGR